VEEAGGPAEFGYYAASGGPEQLVDNTYLPARTTHARPRKTRCTPGSRTGESRTCVRTRREAPSRAGSLYAADDAVWVACSCVIWATDGCRLAGRRGRSRRTRATTHLSRETRYGCRAPAAGTSLRGIVRGIPEPGREGPDTSLFTTSSWPTAQLRRSAKTLCGPSTADAAKRRGH